MQLKVFILPIKNLGAAEAEMNAFLRGHRVLAVKKEFVTDGENPSGRSAWSIWRVLEWAHCRPAAGPR